MSSISKASTLNEKSRNSTSENVFEEGLSEQNTFLHSMEKKSTKVDFSPISCKKAPFYTRNGHF